MTKQQFNEKYKSYIEDRFEGCSIPDEQFIDFLDVSFKEIIRQYPTFKFSQLKSKFGQIRFYTNLTSEQETIYQKELNEFYQTLK